jgi:23S rRNA pseudouridine1911/1915/1917 synthase
MAARTIRRAYAALAWGHFDASRTTIEGAIGRHAADRKRMAIRPDGRAARTDVEVVARLDVCDLVRLTLHTGRTHQIRVHLQHAGHPVVGDPVYHGGGSRRMSGAGRAAADALERATPRQALHSALLSFKHPVLGTVVECRSEWPGDLTASLAAALPSGLVAGAEPLSYLGFFGHG